MGVDFLRRFPNNELFDIFRTLPADNEFLRQAYDLARPEFEARRIGELVVRVLPAISNPDIYTLTVTNLGAASFEELRIHYEPLLLYAGNFGLDTTHMSNDEAQMSGDPLLLEVLEPGRSVDIERKGYASLERF